MNKGHPMTKIKAVKAWAVINDGKITLIMQPNSKESWREVCVKNGANIIEVLVTPIKPPQSKGKKTGNRR